MTNYNELVDYQVSTMTGNPPYSDDNNARKSFDELYEEYSSKSVEEQIENLKGLGRELFNKLDAIIDNVDVILEVKSDENSNKQVD